MPDVSLFASNGFFNAFYVVCQQSSNTDGQPCSLTAPAYDFAGYGGTSVSTPAFAGIISLINQKTGNRLGNANYVLYDLASRQTTSGTVCNSATGAPAAGCIFNDITTNTISQPCLKGSPNCTVTNSADRYGVLSGWGSTKGYDLASGLGSVNAANLVNNWASSTFRSTATSLSLSPISITHGSPVTATVKVTTTGGTPTGDVSINAMASNGSLGSGDLKSGVFSDQLSGFPGGSYSVQAHYAGDGTFAASDSNAVALTVNPEESNTRLQLLSLNPSTATISSVASGAVYPYGGFYLVRVDVAGVSGQGSATGNVSLSDAGVPLDGGTFRLPWLPFTTGIAISGLFFAGVPRSNRWLPIVFLVLAFAAFATVSGCGSGIVGTHDSSNDNSAPGIYSIIVTATGGSTIQTATVNLVVQ